MTERAIREIWANRDQGRRYYEVGEAGSEAAADEHEAVVVIEDMKKARCLRCDTQADIEFKCIHIHAVRKELDV